MVDPLPLLPLSQVIHYANNPCKRQSHKSCARKMCKKCCIANGGCNLRDHRSPQLSLRPLEKLGLGHATAIPAVQPPSFSSQPMTISLPSTSRSLPSLDPETLRSLELLTSNNPTINLFQQQQDTEDTERLHEESEQQLATQEEADYQCAIANSLGVPYITRMTPAPRNLASSSNASTATASNTVRTVPYCPPKITQHLNNTWMRPTKDDKKKVPRIAKGNPDNRFTVIFWGKV